MPGRGSSAVRVQESAIVLGGRCRHAQAGPLLCPGRGRVGCCSHPPGVADRLHGGGKGCVLVDLCVGHADQQGGGHEGVDHYRIMTGPGGGGTKGRCQQRDTLIQPGGVPGGVFGVKAKQRTPRTDLSRWRWSPRCRPACRSPASSPPQPGWTRSQSLQAGGDSRQTHVGCAGVDKGEGLDSHAWTAATWSANLRVHDSCFQ